MAKCPNCGSVLILTFTRKGEQIAICPNVQSNKQKGIANLPRQEIYCVIANDTKSFLIRTLQCGCKDISKDSGRSWQAFAACRQHH